MERGLLTVTKARPCSYYARACKSSLHRGIFEFQPFNVIKKWYMFLWGKNPTECVSWKNRNVVGQAAETGNLCAPCWVPAFLDSCARMAVGTVASRSGGDREPAPTAVFLRSWGPYSLSVDPDS